jgi:hypothetical protein
MLGLSSKIYWKKIKNSFSHYFNINTKRKSARFIALFLIWLWVLTHDICKKLASPSRLPIFFGLASWLPSHKKAS